MSLSNTIAKSLKPDYSLVGKQNLLLLIDDAMKLVKFYNLSGAEKKALVIEAIQGYVKDDELLLSLLDSVIDQLFQLDPKKYKASRLGKIFC